MPSKILKTQTTELQTAICIIQCPLFRHKIYNTQYVLFKTFSFDGFFLSKSLLTKGTEFLLQTQINLCNLIIQTFDISNLHYLI